MAAPGTKTACCTRCCQRRPPSHSAAAMKIATPLWLDELLFICIELSSFMPPQLAALLLMSLPGAMPALASPPNATPAHGRLERLAGVDFGSLPVRPVEVWLLPWYPQQGPYGLLLMFDGQMLLDPSTTWNAQAWHADIAAVDAVGRRGARPFMASIRPRHAPAAYRPWHQGSGGPLRGPAAKAARRLGRARLRRRRHTQRAVLPVHGPQRRRLGRAPARQHGLADAA